MMDTLVSQVQAAPGGWMSTALGMPKPCSLAGGLEFAWSAIQLTLKKSELSEIMVGTLFKVMSLSFFAMVSDQGARLDSLPSSIHSRRQELVWGHGGFVALGSV
jgi:hypothetical protein